MSKFGALAKEMIFFDCHKRKFPHSSNDPVIQVKFFNISPHKQFMSNHALTVNIPYKNFQTVEEKKILPPAIMKLPVSEIYNTTHNRNNSSPQSIF